VSIAVLHKTFLVLEKLAGGGDSLPLAALSRQVGLPKPTVHRIVKTLGKLGYVAQEESGNYYLTPKLGTLSQGGHYRELRLQAIPHMNRLHEQFNETVNLGVLDGTYIRYLHVLETTRPLRIMLQPNITDEYYSTAVGRAIAAYLPEPQLRSLLKAATLRPITPKTVKSKPQLKKILEETRQRGWAIDDEETVSEVLCYAVPIFQEGYPAAAVSLTMPKVRATRPIRQAVIKALLAIGS
jgi:DNA-binding IclR family transcriptional regulator